MRHFTLGFRGFVDLETPLGSGLKKKIASVCAVTQDLIASDDNADDF